MHTSARSIPEPLFPTFAKQEYSTRHGKIREAMQRAGIDLLLATERENVEYISGYLSSHWFMHGIIPGVVLFPLFGEPCLIVPKFWLGTAQKKSWIRSIFVHPNTHSDPESFAEFVVEIIQQHSWDKAAIGYEAGEEMKLGMPIQQFDHIRARLLGAQWAPCGSILWSARTIKSPMEVELLRRAAVGTCRALERVRDATHPGMTESQIGQLIRQFQIAEGCEDRQFLNVRCGADRYSMTDTLPEDRPIQLGEILILDIGMHRRGYWSDTARCASIGAPSDSYLRTYETVGKALEAALRTICDGALASAPYHAARSVMDDAGHVVHIDMMGHGIGMGMYEPPMLSPIVEGTLKAGMVLCVEPWITLSDNRGVLCREESVVVTEDGYEMLTSPNAQDLWTID